jgi:hypothetical protein
VGSERARRGEREKEKETKRERGERGGFLPKRERTGKEKGDVGRIIREGN